MALLDQGSGGMSGPNDTEEDSTDSINIDTDTQTLGTTSIGTTADVDSGGSDPPSSPDDTGDGDTGTTITMTSVGDDSTSISLGDADPGGGQTFDGTAGAEQPDTPNTVGETLITGGTPSDRQEARDVVYDRVSERQQAQANEPEPDTPEMPEMPDPPDLPTPELPDTGLSPVQLALAAVTVVVAVAGGALAGS